jgi:hypothetical protein
MSIRIEVDQVRTIEAPEVYRVRTRVTYVVGIDPNVFVYATEENTFSHVAFPYDMETYPSTRQAALDAGLGYHRQQEAVKDYGDVTTAIDAAAYVLSRLDTLALTMVRADTEFVGEDSHVSIGT